MSTKTYDPNRMSLPDAVTPPKPAEASVDHLRQLGANEFYPRSWEYRHPGQTLRDLIRPGFFVGETRAHLSVGDEIHYTVGAGKRLPSEWMRGILVVEEKPNTQELPVIVAILHRYPAPTPVRHDGEASDLKAA